MPPVSGKEIMAVYLRGAAKGINNAANLLAAWSIAEAPVESGELRASAMYPANDHSELHSAHVAEEMWAMVSFNTPYAAAQNQGKIVYEGEVTYTVREHARNLASGMQVKVSEHTATIGPGVVEFANHPMGGKAHYLDDPFKKLLGGDFQAIVAGTIAEEMKVLNRM